MPGFFDVKDSLQRPTAEPSPPPMTVSQITVRIGHAVKAAFPAPVRVIGEISNCTVAASGHIYFTLKDQQNGLSCVFFKNDARHLQFRPANGMEVIAAGAVDIYGQRGYYQLKVQSLQLAGQGALELAYQQLKARLEKEGLFAQERKKPLPLYPVRLALVTSRQAAGLQDMLKILQPMHFLRLYLYHVPVQGDGAAARIADALQHLNAKAGRLDQGRGIDLILLGRGGGSLEDLWAFNEEPVARAVAASHIPIITGVGHETDVSIADLVADYHAHTPTQAAQIAVRHWKQAGQTLEYTRTRLNVSVRNQWRDANQRLTTIRQYELFRRPMDSIHRLAQRVDDRQRALSQAIERRIALLRRRVDADRQRLGRFDPASILSRQHRRIQLLQDRLNRAAGMPLRQCRARLDRVAGRLAAQHPHHAVAQRAAKLDFLTERLARAGQTLRLRMHNRIDMLEKQLNALGPQQVLRRGYTMTLDRRGNLVRSAAQLGPGERIHTRFADGELESIIRDARQGELFE